MEGYGDVVKLNAQALDSAGTTQKKFDLYLQGTEAKLNELKDTWQAVWMSTFKSKDLQNIIDGLNNLAKGFEFVVSHVGILPTMLGAATSAFLLLNSTTRSSILNFGMLSTSLIKTGDSLPIVTGNARVAQSALYNLTLAGRAAGAGLTIFGNIAKGVFSFIATTALPVAAIMAVSYAIEKITSAISDANQKQQEAKQKQDDLVKSYSSNSQQIDKLASKYESLSNQVTAGKISNSNQEYLDTMSKLGKLIPDLVVGETAHGDKILASADAVKKEVEYAKQLKEIQDKTTIANFEKDLDSQASKVDTIIKNIDKYKNNAKALAASPMVASGNSKYFDESSVLDAQRQQAANERDLQLALQNSKTYIQDKAKAYMDIEGSTQKLSSSQQKLITSYINESIASKKTIKDGNDFKQFLSDTTNNTADLAKILAQLPNDLNGAFSAKDLLGFSKDQLEYLKSIGLLVKDGGTDWDGYSKALKSVFKDSDTVKKIIDALKDSTKQGSDTTNEMTYSVDQLTKKLSDAKGSFSATKDAIMDMIKSQEFSMAVSATQNQLYTEMSDKLSPVNKLLEDMANGQTLSSSAAMDLIQKVPELSKFLSEQNGQITLNIQGIIDWRDAQVASYQDAINAEKVQIDAQSTGLKTKLTNYGLEIQAILSVAQANQALADAEKKHADNAAKINGSNSPGAMHASMVEQDQYNQVTDGINKIKDAYDSLDQISSMASTGLTQVGTSLDKTSSSTQKSTYVTDQYKNSIDELNTALDKLKSLQQKYPQYSQAYRDALTAENKLLQQQKDLTDAQIKNLSQQIASGNILQTGMISNSSSSGSGSSSSNYNYASGGSTEAQIWNFLKGKGLSDSAIAGIMGNLQVESSFNTQALGPQTKYGRPQGIAQWLGGRLSALQSQPNWTSLDTQMNFLWSEWSKMMPGNFNGLNASQAATTFESLFERSGGSLNSKRISNANSILSQFAGSGGTYSGGSSTTDNSAANQAQAIDQAKSQLLQLQSQEQQYVDQIKANLLEIVNSTVAQFDHAKSQIDADIAKIDYNQNVVSEYSVTWRDLEVQRETDYGKQINLEKQSIDYLNQQIQTNNQLTEAQKATLSDQVLQRQQDILSLEQKIYDQRVQMANATIDAYKQALSTMKDAATKNIDNLINDINKQADQASYKKKLSDAQKSAQDIQNQMNALILDNSPAGKKKLADLKKQLSDQQDSITQMVADNDKQLRIDNLNTQKQAISDYYDNMISDETSFAQMRSDIISANTQQIYDNLQKYAKQIQANVNVLGAGVVNTVIAAIGKVNGYIGNNQLSPITSIASLDTGGYTGSWGSGGKFLLAHEKELMLDKNDTSNVLQIVNVARDFFKNVVKLPDLSKLNMATATTGGNTYNLSINIDKVNGDTNGANTIWNRVVNGLKSMGGDI